LLGDPTPEQFCAALVSVRGDASQQPIPSDADTTRMIITAWARVARAAPPELQPPARVLINEAQRLSTGTANAGPVAPEVGEALLRIGWYASDHCGKELQQLSGR